MKTIEQILKIKAVVLYILKAFPEGVDYIHLFKVMYFAQQDQLKEYANHVRYLCCKKAWSCTCFNL